MSDKDKPSEKALTPDTHDSYLLSASTVRLYGRLIAGIAIYKDQLAASASGPYKRVIERLVPPIRLARIYAFSFEGHFHTLPKPTLFLVSGDGDDQPENDTGLANKANLTFEQGIKRWMFDKDDVTLRADVVTGTLDEILIDATLSPTSKYPITSRAGTPQEASWRDGQMIQRNALR